MGHVVGYTDCLNTERAKAEAIADINELAIQNGDCHAPIQSIRWSNVTCSSREDALNWIRKYQRNWYDQMAVKYYEYGGNKKTQELRTRIAKLREKQEKYEEATIPCVVKTSKYLSCKGCGSKLAREYLPTNWAHCPLCGKTMRSKTNLERINNYQKRISQLDKQLDEEIKKSKLKREWWLIKYEYHV